MCRWPEGGGAALEQGAARVYGDGCAWNDASTLERKPPNHNNPIARMTPWSWSESSWGWNGLAERISTLQASERRQLRCVKGGGGLGRGTEGAGHGRGGSGPGLGRAGTLAHALSPACTPAHPRPFSYTLTLTRTLALSLAAHPLHKTGKHAVRACPAPARPPAPANRLRICAVVLLPLSSLARACAHIRTPRANMRAQLCTPHTTRPCYHAIPSTTTPFPPHIIPNCLYICKNARTDDRLPKATCARRTTDSR